MSKIAGFFKKRWVIQLLGLIALSIIIWFIGPLIAIAGMVPLEGMIVRGLVIVFLLLLWVLYLLWHQLRAQKADKAMMEEISQSDAAPGAEQSAEELSILQERFDEALGVLKKSGKGKSGSQYLYELPWYIIIGPPGSGKTTALVNSGLNFPLSDRFGKDAIRGVGGTRNCDWWFTENAVLLDTAGRYTTQDSHEAVDSAAWLGFLDLLKKHRKRRPINGILIAVSLSDMMLQTEEERSLHARSVRSRIQELNERLGVKAPVYMLFTKSDLVGGFTEFFEDMGREDRAQVWGMTLPLEAVESTEGAVSRFPDEFDALLRRLNDRVLARLHQERDIQRRNLIFAFPQEMASLKEPLSRFLDGVFRPSRFEDRQLLRGIYFTSGTQEGTPIDRLLGNLAQNFGLDRIRLPAFSGRGRSYFIQDLFRSVIFPESSLAGSDKKVELRRAWMQRGAYSGAILLTILTALAWTTSFTRNQVAVGDLENNLEDYQQSIIDLDYRVTDFRQLLPPLDDLRAATEVYPEETPLLMGMGLYQGKKLGPATDSAYRRTLQGRFLYSLGARLEDYLQSREQKDLLREALKSYLMLGHPEHLDPEQIKLFMSVDWGNRLAGDSEAQNRLMNHLESLLDPRFKPLPLNLKLVAQARQVLTEIPLSQQIYSQIRQRSAADRSKDFLLGTALGRHGDLVFGVNEGSLEKTRIPALYTRRGFYNIFLPQTLEQAEAALSENWILADTDAGEISDAEALRLVKAVKDLYAEDYITAWRSLLDGMRIVKIRSLPQSVEVLDVASGPSSPLRKLLRVVADNTTLSKVPSDEKMAAAADKAKGMADIAAELSTTAYQKKNRLERLMRAAGKSGVETPGKSLDPVAVQVEETFERLIELAKAQGDNPAPLEGLIGDLGDLHASLADLEAAGGSAALAAAKQRASGSKDPTKRLQRRAKRLPRPVNEWIYALTERGWGVVVGSSRNELAKRWQAEVLPLCRRGIQGRYPLTKETEKEVTLSDFSRFFGPGQVMDKFFEENIKPFADTNRSPWRWKKAGGHPMGVSANTLRQFEHATRIREVFFAEGGKRPKIAFSLKPSYLDAEVSRFLLDLDGQKLSYRHGPARNTRMQWPAPDGSGQVRILFENLKGRTSADSKDGVWAWFKLLDQAVVKDTAMADRFLVSFSLGGQTARFELRADSIINPFRMPELEAFRCPAKL